MARIKVIYVITKSNWGGAQRYVYDLATNLPKEQFETKLIAGQGQELPLKLAATGIETITLPRLDRDLSLFDDLKIFLSLIKLLRREQPDIIHLNSPKAGGLGALAARIAGVKKIIYTAHGWTFNESRPWPAQALIWLASWITVLLTHTTITITTSEQAQGLKMPWCAKKIRLIHNGLTTPNFIPRLAAREKLGANTILIGTIAELHRNKGLEYLIRALSDIKEQNWQAVIIGGGEEKTYLEELITKLRLENKVRLAGFIDNAAELLPAFDIFVLPSLKEGLPYVVLEAGLARLPVIATAVGGLPEIITREYSGLLIPPKNSEMLTEAIHTLINSTTLRQEFGERLERQVIAQYSLEKMVKQFIELYS
jgi:glycosyltransferase involved in cell wall biosynthesis